MRQDSKWIWTNDLQYDVNHWINVRRVFKVFTVSPDAKLLISVDTDYVVWLNGVFINLGQFSDYPQDKHYDILDIGQFLVKGENCLSILAYYQGVGTCRYSKGKAGLIFSLVNGDEQIQSDNLCKIRTSPAYVNGPVDLVTIQLGLTISYDASRDDDWRSLDYNDHLWPQALCLAVGTAGYWESLLPRPLPKLSLKSLGGRCIRKGEITFAKQTGSFADQMCSSTFSNTEEISRTASEPYIKVTNANGCQGAFLLFDLGREECGYLELDVEAAEGAIIDIAHGEHLDDGRVRCKIGKRNFADRYICKQGRQKWLMPCRKLGCRYIELHTKKFNGTVCVHNVGLLIASYPLEAKGAFVSSDTVHNRIKDIAVYTAKLCMHEHYEDTPWREQSLYAMDTKNQALCGYYMFGEYDFPEVSLRLLGKGMSQDGYLALCAPCDIELTIPCFSMAWITAIRDYVLYSGRTSLAHEFWPQIKKMLEIYLAGRDTPGLMPTPKGKRYWNMYEWSQGLAGENIEIGEFNNSHSYHSCLNLFLIEALDAASQIGTWLGETQSNVFKKEAGNIRIAINAVIPRSVNRIFANDAETSHRQFSQLTQALMLYNGILKDKDAQALRYEIVHNTSLVPATLSMMCYVYEALLQDREMYASMVFEHIKTTWGHMVASGHTTFWETIKGAADFEGAGSLCHGWSVVPTYFYYAYVLGIRPLDIGFKRFIIDPITCGLSHAEGIVPTPHGNIEVSWRQDGQVCHATIIHPNSIKPILGNTCAASGKWKFNVSSRCNDLPSDKKTNFYTNVEQSAKG